MAIDIERDYAEEEYNRRFCPVCGTAPCASADGHTSDGSFEEEDIDATAAVAAQERRIAALEGRVAALERAAYRVATDMNGGA